MVEGSKAASRLMNSLKWANRPRWNSGTASVPVSPEEMLRQEYAHVLGRPDWKTSALSLPELIKTLQTHSGDSRPAALCLSGGGIRSATFSLGVLQWLAGKGKLKDFHYLSTVSGGGYIGSFLVNGLRQAYADAWRARMDLVRQADPALWDAREKRIAELGKAGRGKLNPAERAELAGLYREVRALRRQARPQDQREVEGWLARLGNSAGTGQAAQAAGANRISGGVTDPIAPLRAYSNYLSPTGGLSTDAFALAAIFLRNLLLNLAVWLPLIAAVVALPRLYIALLGGGPSLNPHTWAEWWPLWLTLLAITLGIGYIVADLPPPTASQPVAQQTAPSNRFSLLCFLPITGAAVMLSLLGAWTEPLHKLDLWVFALGGAVAHGLGILIGLPLRRWRKIGLRPPSYTGVVVVLIVGAAGGALASVVLSQLGKGAVVLQLSPMQQLLYASLSVPALTGAFWLAMALQAGLTGRVSSEEDREWWARATAAWLKFTLIWLAAFAVTVWAPLFILEHAADAGFTTVQLGMGGGALGVVTALFGYWSKHADKVKSRVKGILDATGVKLLDLMAGVVLLTVVLTLTLTWNVVLDRCQSWRLTSSLCLEDQQVRTDNAPLARPTVVPVARVAASDRASPPARAIDPASGDAAESGVAADAQLFAHLLLNGSGRMLIVTSAVLVALSSLMAACIGANQFSLHGMYGNRLVRAYLGSGRRTRHPHWFTRFDPDDNPKLADMATPLRGEDGHPRLFPLINIALNLVKPSEERLDWQQRKAASFFATPLHCGSYHLGFRPTRLYAGGMSLGRAMTISGAAASPNMGYHSSPLVTAVMTLFNVRLGWWSPNPRVNPDWKQERPALGLDIMLAEAGGATGDEDDFVYLSDGGHFDNTGLYEMVRRRCRYIVVVDATCDGEFKWNDLLDTVRKIRVDFGVPIKFDDELPGGGRDPKNPRRVTGLIQYSARDAGIHDGVLVVLKPLLLPEDPPELAAYARDSAKVGTPADDPSRFPHQSTADQFYDEQQFESYRLLGWLTADAALGEKEQPPLGAGGKQQAAPGAGAQSGQESGGIAQLVQQMGSGMALATALTVGGTLGVAGSVALQPSQISLSAEDRALLKSGLQGSTDGARLRLDEEDRKFLQEGVRIRLDSETEEGLRGAAATFEAVFAKLINWTPPPASGPPGGTVKVTLDSDSIDALNKLKVAIDLAVTSKTPGSFLSLHDAILRLEQRLAVLPEREPLTEALAELTRAVRAVSPRQNIRGQEGVQR